MKFVVFFFLFFSPLYFPTDAWKVDARINTSEQNSTSFSSFGLTPGVSGMYMLPKILLSVPYQMEIEFANIINLYLFPMVF